MHLNLIFELVALLLVYFDCMRAVQTNKCVLVNLFETSGF